MAYKFNDDKYLRDFELFSKTFKTTALTVAKFCNFYWDGKEKWYWPSPEINNEEFVKMIGKELDQLPASLEKPFTFVMDIVPPDDKLQRRRLVGKFDYHDTPNSWVLNLSDEEWVSVKNELSKKSLPDDLFIEQN